MTDTGSHRHSAHRAPRNRPPPLLVIAATGLAVVIALGVTLMIVRARGGGTGNKDEATAVALPSSEPAPAPQPGLTPPVPARNPTPEHRRTTAAPSAAAAEPPSDEVPVWERKPLRTDQPFPEEARIDPPMPPIKIPPEMLIPPATPDAGAR